MKLLSFISSMFLLTCQQGISEKKEPALYSRDSLFISHTTANWLKTNEVSWFENTRYNCLNGKSGSPLVYTDTILYNQSKTKLYAIVIIRRDTCTITKNDYDSFYSPLKNPYVFDARSIIGFKDTVSNLWKLYHHAALIQQGFAEYDQLSKQTRQFFFSEFKNHSMLWIQQSNNLLYKRIGYNINDVDFWTKSFIWEKGLCLKGYYNFELEGIVLNKPPQVISMPVVVYPDSLLKLYR